MNCKGKTVLEIVEYLNKKKTRRKEEHKSLSIQNATRILIILLDNIKRLFFFVIRKKFLIYHVLLYVLVFETEGLELDFVK